jgi:hypothetical protein
MNPEYIVYLRERQASTSVGASTARGMGPGGTISAARDFLKAIDLERFKADSLTEFERELDAVTVELQKSLPMKAQKWGSARKFLNIFLRGCCYNKYLCDHYGLQRLESWLEVPLDSYTANGLKKIAGRRKLPRWKGVIHLTPGDSSEIQEFAWLPAGLDGVNRVDLDVRFWRREG